eukprot:130232_1
MATLAYLFVILFIAVSNGIKKRKIIIDTDGGVNDAFALIWALYAFNNKLLSIEALTTVKTDLPSYDAFRNVIYMVNITKRSKMRKKILSIPIGKPIDNNNNNNETHIP